jgi:hypothetical protein
MAGERTDLGHGHSLKWASWSPDRELNPQYAGLPDVEHCTAIVRHDLRPDDPKRTCQKQGYCEGAITIDSSVARQLWPAGPFWELQSAEPLTLSPSLLCHCGDHGFIREGRWVVA